ncbi:MAG: ROK family transcriptional regulator [Sphingopyxis sp.]
MLRDILAFHDPDSLTESEVRILSCILRGRAMTQPEISKSTGLSQQTVSRLANELIDRGALRPGRRQSSGRRGQPRLEIEIAPDHAYSLGVALMTDAMSVLLMDLSGNVVGYDYRQMPQMSREAVFKELDQVTERLLQNHCVGRDRLFGLGVGISGYSLDGRSRFNPPLELEDWAMVELDRLFTDETGLPTWVENDGNAAAIGESFLGVGRTHSHFVYLFVAAGIGGGVINHHRLWRGVNGNSGEIGLLLPRDIYRRPGLETLFDKLVANGTALDSISDMLARFDSNWPGVDEWVEEARLPFSLIASSITALLDPEAIILGGRIPAVLAQRIIAGIEIYDHKRRSEPRPLPKIKLSETQVDACAIGAAMLPLEHHFFSSML